MRPYVSGPDTQLPIEGFGVDWASAVTDVETVGLESSRYLSAIAEFTNNTELGDSILALHARLAPSTELDRLMAVLHSVPARVPPFAAHLLARTSLATALERFASAPDALFERVMESRFELASTFLLEGTLAQDLYLYGMYQHFYDSRSPDEARDIARDLLHATVGSDLATTFALTTRAPWGDWFDEHSCSDRSWILIDERSRGVWVYAFSHSD